MRTVYDAILAVVLAMALVSPFAAMSADPRDEASLRVMDQPDAGNLKLQDSSGREIPLSERYWVFSSASTSVEWKLTVSDTATGAQVEWRRGDRRTQLQLGPGSQITFFPTPDHRKRADRFVVNKGPVTLVPIAGDVSLAAVIGAQGHRGFAQVKRPLQINHTPDGPTTITALGGGPSGSTTFTILEGEGSAIFTLDMADTATDRDTLVNSTATGVGAGRNDEIVNRALRDLSFTPGTGRLSYTPGASDSPDSSLPLSSQADSTPSVSDTVNIPISPINDPPTIVVPGRQSFLTDFDNLFSSGGLPPSVGNTVNSTIAPINDTPTLAVPGQQSHVKDWDIYRSTLLEDMATDTDIIHVLSSDMVVENHHTFSGLRVQSSASESLVPRLNNALNVNNAFTNNPAGAGIAGGNTVLGPLVGANNVVSATSGGPPQSLVDFSGDTLIPLTGNDFSWFNNINWFVNNTTAREGGSTNDVSIVRATGGSGPYFGLPWSAGNVNAGIHFVYGVPTPLAQIPMTGTVAYNFVATTLPTYSDGSTLPGTLAGAAAVDFGNLRVGVNMTATMPNQIYTIQTPGGTVNPAASTVIIGNLAGQRVLNGLGNYTTSPTICPTGCATSIGGHFFGANALFTSVLFNTNLGGGVSLNGAALGQR